ncbi:MAG TPA: hypothetical protein VFW47_14195 [Phenylobacterium sp.]|nr:hypothetical protein [Phenylobacterium sp.]
MFFQVLALTAALGAPSSTLAGVTPVLDTIPASAFVVDCQVSGQALTDCRVVDADPATNARAATALKLAAQIQVPESMALDNPGRIKIRLNVNP